MKKDFSGYFPSGFKNSFRIDHARFVAKYSKYKKTFDKEPREKSKISRDELSHEIKITTDFNVVNSVRRENKVLAIKNPLYGIFNPCFCDKFYNNNMEILRYTINFNCIKCLPYVSIVFGITKQH